MTPEHKAQVQAIAEKATALKGELLETHMAYRAHVRTLPREELDRTTDDTSYDLRDAINALGEAVDLLEQI